MNFYEIAGKRRSCRSYDPDKTVEEEKLGRILEVARLSPSACNGQPYHMTVCSGEYAKKVAPALMGMGMNKFCKNVPLFIVISEEHYVPSAALGAKVKRNDYRSIDIGILAAYITAQATEEGLESCILGWLDDAKIREVCSLQGTVRLVIAIGYSLDGGVIPEKKRKDVSELITILK